MKRIISIFLVINFSLFIISLAVSFAILFRPFYYMHINALNLPDKTGFTYSEIKEAYDDVLDYGVFYKDFSTGVLKHSDEGYDHFRDCRTLFTINFVIFIITSIIIILKKKFFNDIKLFKYNVGFWSSILNIVLFLSLIIISLCVDFDKIFTIFHNIFFLGKKNWLFSPSQDEIVKILPQRFFINCGILIISIIMILSIIIIIREIYKNKNCKKKINVV